MADKEKILTLIDEMIKEAQEEPQWKAESALKCLKKELLKEQKPVEPEEEVLNEIDRLYRCPKCHKCFFYEKQKYCDQCGQAVKWE